MPTKSELLFNRAKKVIPSGVNSPVRYYEPYPFFAASGLGSKLVTVDHNTYIDYCMGYGALLLGHASGTIIEAVKNQIDNGSLFCVPTENEVRLAEQISQIIPCAEMTRLVNTGSEATMNAIRLSRAFTKRKKVIKFEGCYHGAHDYVLVGAGSGAAGVPASEGTIEEVSAQTIVVPYNDIGFLERVVEKNTDVACIILEPVIANMGIILPEKNFLTEIRKLTHQHDIVLIFDEVITGFRLALGGAGEFFGIKPDIATFAKALGNGFPIAAICGKEEIMSNLAPAGKVYQASTYAGNPLSVSASIAVIDTLLQLKNELYPKVARMCDDIVNGIKDHIVDSGADMVINNIGSMYQLFFTGGKVRDASAARKSDIALFKKFYEQLLARGIFIPPSQFETCFVSYSHNEDDIDKTVESYGEAMTALQR